MNNENTSLQYPYSTQETERPTAQSSPIPKVDESLGSTRSAIRLEETTQLSNIYTPTTLHYPPENFKNMTQISPVMHGFSFSSCVNPHENALFLSNLFAKLPKPPGYGSASTSLITDQHNIPTAFEFNNSTVYRDQSSWPMNNLPHLDSGYNSLQQNIPDFISAPVCFPGVFTSIGLQNL